MGEARNGKPFSGASTKGNVDMKLSDKQAMFAERLAAFIAVVNTLRDEHGLRKYRIRFGDVYRDPRAKYGHPRSLHRKRLAADLILDAWDGESWVYQRSTEAYREIGELWESMGGTWGGRFNDGNHFSFKHGDMR